MKKSTIIIMLLIVIIILLIFVVAPAKAFTSMHRGDVNITGLLNDTEQGKIYMNATNGLFLKTSDFNRLQMMSSSSSTLKGISLWIYDGQASVIEGTYGRLRFFANGADNVEYNITGTGLQYTFPNNNLGCGLALGRRRCVGINLASNSSGVQFIPSYGTGPIPLNTTTTFYNNLTFYTYTSSTYGYKGRTGLPCQFIMGGNTSSYCNTFRNNTADLLYARRYGLNNGSDFDSIYGARTNGALFNNTVYSGRGTYLNTTALWLTPDSWINTTQGTGTLKVQAKWLNMSSAVVGIGSMAGGAINSFDFSTKATITSNFIYKQVPTGNSLTIAIGTGGITISSGSHTYIMFGDALVPSATRLLGIGNRTKVWGEQWSQDQNVLRWSNLTKVWFGNGTYAKIQSDKIHFNRTVSFQNVSRIDNGTNQPMGYLRLVSGGLNVSNNYVTKNTMVTYSEYTNYSHFISKQGGGWFMINSSSRSDNGLIKYILYEPNYRT